MRLKHKILIVDDNKLLCHNLKDILELKGYQVICVYDGDQAIEAVKNDRFNVALMDVKMPGKNGIDTLKTLKQIAPELTVIFITAFA
ncbi:MAG: response regulator, partial [Candidatus Omnitrophota bacterium]